MPGDGPVLLRMTDIEVLDILKVICAVMGDLHKSRMFDSQTMQTSNGHSCKANNVQQIKTHNADVNDANSYMPDYCRSGINRAADKRASKVSMNKTLNEFGKSFAGIGCFTGQG